MFPPPLCLIANIGLISIAADDTPWCVAVTAITEAGRVRVLLTPEHAIVGGSQRAPAERVRRLTDAEAVAEIICRCERDGIKPHAAAAEFVDYVANPSDADFESIRRRLCEGVKRARTKQRTVAE